MMMTRIISRDDYTVYTALRGPDIQDVPYLKWLITGRIRALIGYTEHAVICRHSPTFTHGDWDAIERELLTFAGSYRFNRGDSIELTNAKEGIKSALRHYLGHAYEALTLLLPLGDSTVDPADRALTQLVHGLWATLHLYDVLPHLLAKAKPALLDHPKEGDETTQNEEDSQ